jgi:hypothetical protein
VKAMMVIPGEEEEEDEWERTAFGLGGYKAG